MKVLREIFVIFVFTWSLICVSKCDQDKDVATKIIDFYTLQSKSITNEKCLRQTNLYRKALIDHEKWALEMFDASSKISPGYFGGNINDFGAFEQCLNVKVNTSDGIVKGQHCLVCVKGLIWFTPVAFQLQRGYPMISSPIHPKYPEINAYLMHINPRPVLMVTPPTHKFSICVPDGCSRHDVEVHLQEMLSWNNSVKIIVKPKNVQTLDTQWKIRSYDWIGIGFFIFVATILILSTSYDMFLHYSRKDSHHWLWTSFSMLSNGKALVKTFNHPDLLPCLDGLRFLSIFWITMGHRYHLEKFLPNFNSVTSFKVFQEFIDQFVGANQVPVNTFLMIGGCLLMYGYLRGREREPNFNIFKFYIRRYIRLTPAFAAVVLFYVTVVRKLGFGPIWNDLVPEFCVSCEKNWWAALLYIQNYYPADKLCVEQTWYLCVDTQLFWISPLILIPIWKFRKIVYYYIGALVFMAVLIPVYIVYTDEIIPNGKPNQEYFKKFYITTHCRAVGWLVGLGLGHLLYETRKKKIEISWILATIFWTVTATLCLFAALGAFPFTQPDYVYNRLYTAIFLGFSPLLWSLGLVWLIFACTKGYGGILNWFLSRPIFQVLSKLSYCIFLTHFIVIYIIAYSRQIPAYFTKINMFYIFVGDLALVSVISLFWALAFEMPFMIIDNRIFKASVKKRSVLRQNQNFNVTTENVKANNNSENTHFSARL